MIKKRTCLFLAIFCLSTSAVIAQTENRQEVTIGVVLDGRNPSTQNFLDALTSNLTTLLGVRYDLVPFGEKVLDSSWSAEAARANYRRLAEDPEVDIILGLGVLTGAAIAGDGNYPKPVIALGILEPNKQGLPAPIEDRSGVPNLSYVLLNRSIGRDLDAFHSVFPYEKVGLVFFDEVVKQLSSRPLLFDDVMERNSVSFELVTMSANIGEVLDSVPDDVDALYLGYLGPFEGEVETRLIDEINRRGIPSFASSAEDVERGVLASIAPLADTRKILRRISLNVEAILGGEDPADLPVTLTFEERLRINMRTADLIGYVPKFSVLSQAELVNEFAQKGSQTWTLVKVMKGAMRSNLDLDIERANVAVAKDDLSLAKSDYLPSLDVDITGKQIDRDRGEGSFGARNLSGGASFRQLVFSEEVFGNIDTQRYLLLASESGLQGLRLDVALEAAVAYLEVLRAQASWRIQKNDVDLTRKNLGIAKQREAVGYSGRSDVLRWESRFVTSTTDLLELRNEVDRAKMKLNVILNRPVAEPFAAQEVDLAGDGYLDRTGGLGQHIDTPSSLATLTNFLVEEAVRLSPEARQVAANIDALERTSRSLRRRPWIPSIGFGADYGHVFSRGGTGSDVQGSNPVDDQWALSLSASIPLFAGGSQRIAARQTGVEVTALKLQAEKVYQALEFNVRSAMLDVVVSNVNLEASARSAELSRESLGLVQDEYARGRAPMADLIDAQNASLSDNLSVQISEYRFLSSALQLERAVGEYGMLRTPAEQQRFSERFDTYLNESNR